MITVALCCLFVGLCVGAGLALFVRLSQPWPEGWHAEMLSLQAEACDRLEKIVITLIDTRGSG